MTERQPVLIVEDERLVARDLQRTLLGFGYDAFAIAASAEEALARAHERCPAVVLMDIRIQGELDGIATAKLIRDRFASAVVYLTAHSDSDTLARATATAPYGYLQKPVRPAELRSAIEISLHKRKQEARWLEGQRWVDSALDSSQEAVLALNEDGTILEASRMFCDWVGLPLIELRGRPLRELVVLLGAGGDRAMLEPERDALRDGSVHEGDALLIAGGVERNVHFRAQPVLHGPRQLGTLLIISDRSRRLVDCALTSCQDLEQQLHRSLHDHDLLIQEIQHRVKNNLQVVASLLRLQAMHARDPEMRLKLSESESRVQSIALVHAQLHNSPHPTRIAFREYATALLQELMRTHDALGRSIEFDVRGAELSLSVEQAVPCGLIINELASNSLKHAFNGRRAALTPGETRAGTIWVELARDAEQLTLCVRDDGVGFPEGFDPRLASSLGLDLVFTFAEQLNARVEWHGATGTAFTFCFSEK
jgi:two-component sensor histidine kinase